MATQQAAPGTRMLGGERQHIMQCFKDADLMKTLSRNNRNHGNYWTCCVISGVTTHSQMHSHTFGIWLDTSKDLHTTCAYLCVLSYSGLYYMTEEDQANWYQKNTLPRNVKSHAAEKKGGESILKNSWWLPQSEVGQFEKAWESLLEDHNCTSELLQHANCTLPSNSYYLNVEKCRIKNTINKG